MTDATTLATAETKLLEHLRRMPVIFVGELADHLGLPVARVRSLLDLLAGEGRVARDRAGGAWRAV